MMTEHAHRLSSDPAGTECSYKRRESRVFADEAAMAPPIHEVEMRIDLEQALHRLDPRPRPKRREAAKANLRQGWNEQGRDSVPRWHQDRQCPRAEQAFERHPARAEVAQHQHCRPVGTELHLLLARG